MTSVSTRKSVRVDNWPAVFRVRSSTLVLAVAGLIVLAWIGVVLIDLIQIVGQKDRPFWEQLFHNNRPAEWMQWTLLLTGAVLSANLAARLSGEPARFFFLMAFGMVLIFFEDTSDLRHVLFHDYWTPRFGMEIAGIPTRVVSDSIYFSLIATVPLYSLLRYGWSIWDCLPARLYMLAGFALYAMAGGLSAIRHLGDLYVNLGRMIDTRLFSSRWPPPPEANGDRAHFYVMDSLVEESVELLGAACLVAMVLAYAAYFRARRETLEHIS
jgi:hypothetical protein